MKMLRAGTLKHYVNVMTPATTKDEHGRPRGQDEIYIKDVPCSIEYLSGREAELARQQYGAASMKVQCYGDPKKPLRLTHYLQFGSRRLEIGDIKDVKQNGVVLELLVGEKVNG